MYKRRMTPETLDKLMVSGGKKFVSIEEGAMLLSMGIHGLRKSSYGSWINGKQSKTKQRIWTHNIIYGE